MEGVVGRLFFFDGNKEVVVVVVRFQENRWSKNIGCFKLPIISIAPS